MFFQLVYIGNFARVVTSGQILIAIVGLILFLGDESSSFLNAKVASQLNCNDFANIE